MQKPKNNSALKRKGPQRNQYETILIVCEGEKTEPNYLNEIKNDLKISTVTIYKNTKGLKPDEVLSTAKKEYKRANEGYDRIYCVFDEDEHSTYKDTIHRIKQKPKNIKCKIYAINSAPCFEIWLLLHFEYTTKQYHTPRCSICDGVIKELEKYIPEYSKNYINLYLEIKDKTKFAIDNAKKLRAYCESNEVNHPYTNMDVLVEDLQKLGSQK